MNHITLFGDNRAWNATYTVDGKHLYLASAYGGERTPLKPGANPEATAHKLLETVIKRWSPSMTRARFKPIVPYAANARR